MASNTNDSRLFSKSNNSFLVHSRDCSPLWRCWVPRWLQHYVHPLTHSCYFLFSSTDEPTSDARLFCLYWLFACPWHFVQWLSILQPALLEPPRVSLSFSYPITLTSSGTTLLILSISEWGLYVFGVLGPVDWTLLHQPLGVMSCPQREHFPSELLWLIDGALD